MVPGVVPMCHLVSLARRRVSRLAVDSNAYRERSPLDVHV